MLFRSLSDGVTSIFDEEEDDIFLLCEYLSRPWPEIPWEDVYEIGVATWMFVSVLNEKTFKHIFPSLLCFTENHDNLLTDSFIENHLNLKNVYKDWEMEFFISLDNEVYELIVALLRSKKESLAADALETW
mgnify:CR=1 FL=1